MRAILADIHGNLEALDAVDATARQVHANPDLPDIHGDRLREGR